MDNMLMELPLYMHATTELNYALGSHLTAVKTVPLSSVSVSAAAGNSRKVTYFEMHV